MDTQLEALLDKIKAEGVDGAQKQADQIIASAEENAQRIVESARKEAAAIIDQATQERAKQEFAGSEAVKHAARDVILSVQTQLAAMYKGVVEDVTNESLSGDILEKAILGVMDAWSNDLESDMSIILTPGELDRLEAGLRNALSGKLTAGVEIKADASLKSGFRIGNQDGSAYYDFSVDAVAEAISAYVGPRLAAIARDSVRNA